MWEWNFGDGQTATGPLASHTYVEPGHYTVQLAVTDNEGATATTTVPVDARALGILRLRGKVRFDRDARDSLMLRGTIPALAAGFSPDGLAMGLDVAGAQQAFTLDAKGKGRDAATGSSVRLKLPSGFAGGDVAFKATLRGGSWSDDWADEGLVDETVKDKAATLALAITLGSQPYVGSAEVLYRATAAKGGSFRED